jgi:hypothetical protein
VKLRWSSAVVKNVTDCELCLRPMLGAKKAEPHEWPAEAIFELRPLSRAKDT